MKLIQQIFKAPDGPVSVSYKLYGKHRVDWHAKERKAEERRLKQLSKQVRGLR